MLMQPPPIVIKSTSVSQNSPEDNNATTTPTIKKKSRKAKIPCTPFINEVFAKAKCPNVHDLVDDFANVLGSTFLQGAKD